MAQSGLSGTVYGPLYYPRRAIVLKRAAAPLGSAPFLHRGWLARAPAHQRVSTGRRCGPSMAVINMADRSIAAADHSIAAAEHSRAMDHSIAGTDHSIAGTERSIAGTERRTPGMVRREGSPLSRRHALVSLAAAAVKPKAIRSVFMTSLNFGASNEGSGW